MKVQVGKWGNSLGVRIPSAFVKELSLHDGSELELEEKDGVLVIRPVPKAKYSLDGLLARMIPESIHAATDWGRDEGREEW